MEKSFKKKVDIVVSCYNEEGNIYPFFYECKKYLNDKKYLYNVVFVNDGSNDKTYENIFNLAHENKSELEISYISFVHNFGHEYTMWAGIDISVADYIIFIDCDLQHPVSKIPQILEKFENGFDCVLLKRIDYGNKTPIIKKFFSYSFYYFSRYILGNNIEPNVSDFFAINSDLARVIRKNYNTCLRFLRMFIQKEGNNIAIIEYDCLERKSGKSKFNFLKLVKLALTSEFARSLFLRNIYTPNNKRTKYIIDSKKTIYK